MRLAHQQAGENNIEILPMMFARVIRTTHPRLKNTCKRGSCGGLKTEQPVVQVALVLPLDKEWESRRRADSLGSPDQRESDLPVYRSAPPTPTVCEK